MTAHSVFSGLKNVFASIMPTDNGELSNGQDVVIKFLSAENLPNMDLLSETDPYFVATIDNEITYKSTILPDTLSPKWTDEEWIVRNIPLDAKLIVILYDKDDNSLSDEYIGQFEITNLNEYKASPEGHIILGANGKNCGQFHLTIESTKLTDESEKVPRYTFDGPCHFSRHSSSIVGHLTSINSSRTYSTWRIQLRRISVFFRPVDRQPWNRRYRVAQNIFDGSPRATAKQCAFKLAHKLLYGTTMKNHETGRLTNADDLWKLIFTDNTTKQIRKCLYTYIIDDNAWRFSETGQEYFTDYASKHALHANCAESVHYAGQFHPRPKFGWDRCDDEWELVLDNASGTYAPNGEQLNNLKRLLEFNFPGLNVVVHDRNDPLILESMETLRLAQMKTKSTSGTVNSLVVNPYLLNKK